jgi:arsenate reductase (thioredoxin)
MTRMAAIIAEATGADLPGVLALLAAVDLPTEGVTDHAANAVIGRDGSSVVASAVLEVYGPAALLRSVAVAPAYRGQGLGERISRAALDLARRRGVRTVCLLTTTAADFFSRRLGFRPIARGDVPDGVRASAELTRLCPDSAQAMAYDLGTPPVQVIFACIHNAGRSQMAAAFFNELADPTKATAVSAGTEPASRVHPEIVTVMREVGIDLSRAEPRRLTDAVAATARILVTMGCGEACPLVPGLRRIDWALPDPKGQPIEQVRAIRDDVRRHVATLVAAEGWQLLPSP